MQQDDLFDRRSTVHSLVERHTAEGLLKATLGHTKTPGRNAPIDVLAGRRGARTIRSAAVRAERAAAEGFGDGREVEELRSYSYAAWAHAGLPRRALKNPSDSWTVDTGFAQLEVQPGTARKEGEGPPPYLGVPYGAYARLALLHWQSEACKTSSREIFIGKSVSDALRRMKLPHGSDANTQLREQIERLCVCLIRFSAEHGGSGMALNHTIVEKFFYDYSNVIGRKGKGRRFVTRLLLSNDYYEQLVKYPVIMDENAIIDLRDSPTAIDIYTWLCWRLPHIKEEVRIGWTALKAQLGPNVKSMSDFKPHFRECFTAAHAVYRQANMELADFGVILRPSDPPVPLCHPVQGVLLTG